MKNCHKNFLKIEIPVIKKLYELYRFTYKLITKFPKHERYNLGEKLKNCILEIIELIIFGNQQQKNFKDCYLLNANAKIEVLKLLYRLGFDLKIIDEKGYLHSEELLQEIGKMLNGWIKYLKTN